MQLRTSKALGGLALAGIVALVTSVAAPADAQDQSTTQILNQCSSNTGDMAQAQACVQAAGIFLKSLIPGHTLDPLIDVLGDQVHSVGIDPLPQDPDVSTPPAPSDQSTDDDSNQ